MGRPILVRGARQLLTLHGPSTPRRGADLRNLGIVQDGAVLIVDGLIRDVGSSRRLENLAASRDAHEINASGRVVLPGFVDSHTHLVSGPARLTDYEMSLAGASQEEITQAGGGFPAISKSMQGVSSRTLEGQALKMAQDCIRHGTTTIEAKSGYGVTKAGELRILRALARVNQRTGMIVPTFVGARRLMNDQAPEEYLEWMCREMLPLVRKRKLAEFAGVYCEDGMFTVEQARRYLLTAQRLGFGLKVHGEASAVGLAVEAGAVSVDCAHRLNGADCAALGASNTLATLLPGSVFHLGQCEYAPARTLIDSGAAVALATSYNPETSPSHNMQTTLSLACRMMAMTPAEAISAATINGAHALRRSHLIGSLEFGKSADLVVMNAPDYREIPYHFGVNLVELTMQKGRVVHQMSDVKWPAAK
jgi:imidazolonepropionase